ncbi:MAG: leucine-rich repeat domain-containing protein, partial [Clostridiaceae bacterium]|nr:leucine-rich repeat domain-containing protein [Clostridiaceae bacterium]
MKNSFSHNAAQQKSVSVLITESTIITFPDKNLEKTIREDLQCPSGDILMGDVSKITTLKNTEDKNIKNLSGIENFINLEYLNLSDNQISNIEPLEGLTNLTSLKLHTNQIKNIKPLKELTNLTDLDLASNQIRSIEPLEGLTKLISLDLDTNQIKDYSPVSDYYENLERTDIASANISNNHETTIDNNLVAENTVTPLKPEETKVIDKASESTIIALKPEETKVIDKTSESTI